MWNIEEAMIRLYVELAAPRRRNERGDVPGWVLVTVMSAGIVAGLWTFAEGELRSMLSSALNKVQ